MDLIILSGLSGAGKSTAAKYMEDMGFFCIDNLPPQLLTALLEAIRKHPESADLGDSRYALVMDARSASRFGQLSPVLGELRRQEKNVRIIFLEAGDEIILSRYKQSRRNHPLAGKGNLLSGIREERRRLAPVRELATNVIDTGHIKGVELRDLLYGMLHEAGQDQRLQIFIQSFGFKYGLPLDLDLLVDVRFIPNPFYIPELRPLCGRDQPILDFLNAYPETEDFIQRYADFLQFSLPYYQREGKVRLNIGIGCTGGRHRSVALAEALKKRLEKLGYPILLDHRDIERDPQEGM